VCSSDLRPKAYRASETLSQLLTKLFGIDTGKRVTIIDMSRVPFDVINVLVSLLGRVVYDFNLWNRSRRDFPITIVFEEAHAYLSMLGRSRAARKTVEQIAKRDFDALEASDAIVGEISTPSHGVGMELEFAVMKGKKVFCLRRPDSRVSGLIAGTAGIRVFTYLDRKDAVRQVRGILSEES
jgi:hypothetical protein